MSDQFLYDPLKYAFYALICDYFDDPGMQKVSQDQNYSVYACKISTLLLNEYRYLVAIINNDHMELGTIKKLSDLKWISFQTRILESDIYYHAVQHSYDTKNTLKYHYQVRQLNNSTEKSVYRLENNAFPVRITLLHQKGLELEYPSTGSLVACLETYQTIVTFS